MINQPKTKRSSLSEGIVTISGVYAVSVDEDPFTTVTELWQP
jgi:hypothetical protein